MVMKTFANSIVEHGLPNASIINISSIVGKYGNIGQSNYTASKAGVELLTKTASKEFGKMGIRVNTIFPGMIKTRMIESVPEKVQDKFKSMIPLGRFGQPEGKMKIILHILYYILFFFFRNCRSYSIFSF